MQVVHFFCTQFWNFWHMTHYAPFHQQTSLSYKSSNIHVKSMCYSQIWQNFEGDEYLSKLGKEYLNASLCKFVVYSLQHSETFDVSHVFLPLTIAELSMLKQSSFLAHPVESTDANSRHNTHLPVILANKNTQNKQPKLNHNILVQFLVKCTC